MPDEVAQVPGAAPAAQTPAGEGAQSAESTSTTPAPEGAQPQGAPTEPQVYGTKAEFEAAFEKRLARERKRLETETAKKYGPDAEYGRQVRENLRRAGYNPDEFPTQVQQAAMLQGVDNVPPQLIQVLQAQQRELAELRTWRDASDKDAATRTVREQIKALEDHADFGEVFKSNREDVLDFCLENGIDDLQAGFGKWLFTDPAALKKVRDNIARGVEQQVLAKAGKTPETSRAPGNPAGAKRALTDKEVRELGDRAKREGRAIELPR